jgi:hypothetical protein
MECAELDQSLIRIGEWDQAGHLQVERIWSYSVPKKLESVWLIDRANARLERMWQHVAYAQTREHMSFYMNGRLIVSAAASRLPHAPVTQVRSFLRRMECALNPWSGPAVYRSWSLGPYTCRSVEWRNRRCQAMGAGSEPGEPCACRL